MRKFQRGEEPPFLAVKWQEWGEDWERRQAQRGTFHWHQHEGVAVNQLLLIPLKEQTQAHCSFCDAFPVSPPSLETVEHFKPKSRFPREAYHWPNLYFCCDFCQGKRDDFDELLLRPDAPDFDFHRYFIWEYTTGELLPNPQATEADRNRAEVTRRLYRLNEKHPSLRMRARRQRIKLQDEPLDELPYRGFVSNESYV